VKALSMSVNALAKELHIPTTRLNDIVRGRVVSPPAPRSGWPVAWAPRRNFGSIFSPPMNLGLLSSGNVGRSRNR
jgi:hypothetical protein